MADAGDAKPTPSATQDVSAGLRPAEQETNLIKNPLGDASSKAPSTNSKDTKPTTYTKAATNAASSAASTASAAASNVFTIFSGGPKKERKPEEDDDAKDEPSGSSKAQKKEEDGEPEEIVFKMRAKLLQFNRIENEWRERGTGDVRLLKHKASGKTRLVMRRDKTLKVCANHFVSSVMRLSPNAGSDRSWVWDVVSDYSDSPPETLTLAIRLANSENANLFKEAFIKAQRDNEALYQNS